MELQNFDFGLAPCRVRFGAGRLTEVADIASQTNARKVAWVVDEHFQNAEGTSPLKSCIALVAADSAIHAMPPGEPDTRSVEACHAFLRDQDADLIVALGGGSTMDATKVARLMLENPGGVAAVAQAQPPLMRPRPALICVPTTAGTGSEVSEMAVISEAGTDIKLRVRSRDGMAEVAILDPELLLSLPKGPTAHTGFDAFTHAFEAYTSLRASEITDLLCRAAIEKLWRWLPYAVDDPQDLKARGECLLASTFAAIAFNSTELGLAHAIAAPLGAQYHVIHGLGNALALPAVTAFNEPAIPAAKRNWLRHAMRSSTVTEGVCKMRERIGLDRGLVDCLPNGFDRDAVAEAAMKSGNIATNARPPTRQAVEIILGAMRDRLDGALPPLDGTRF
ncbi:iron-containing alcohol dehydrogenase family protein [Pelagibius sp.]|uniref:iron-containing alcohol dehydrogenase family protein n=1 Tax=Pelagibius sp. TaxID=1931238 RepID=UPI00260E765F|nr:iron-containing alcohol dehydrogenase [Pelagibius sp.]